MYNQFNGSQNIVELPYSVDIGPEGFPTKEKLRTLLQENFKNASSQTLDRMIKAADSIRVYAPQPGDKLRFVDGEIFTEVPRSQRPIKAELYRNDEYIVSCQIGG